MSTPIGNPNLFLFSNQRVRGEIVTSPRYAMYEAASRTGVNAGTQLVIANDLTQMKTATIKQNVLVGPVTFNVYLVVNGLDYFADSHTDGDETIHEFDLTTLVGLFGSPPLIMNKGETIGWRTDPTSTNRRMSFVCALWADILGYGS